MRVLVTGTEGYLGSLLAPLAVASGQHQGGRPVPGEPTCDCQPDALRAAGDDGDPSVEPNAHP